MPESPARPRLPQRGELPSLPEGGGLQRRKRATPVRDRSSTGSNSTNKPSVTASSDPSNRTVADEHYGSTSIGHVYSPPGSAVQVTGSRQMTSPFEGFVGIPPNLFELKQLKQRVVDFDRLSIKSSEGNERSPPSVLVLNSFRLNKDRQMDWMHKDLHDAGTTLHNTRRLDQDTQNRFNTSIQRSFFILDRLERQSKDSTDSVRASRTKSVITNFETMYTTYRNHLDPPAQRGVEEIHWQQQHLTNTKNLCTSIESMIPYVPDFTRDLPRDTQILQAPSSAANPAQSRGLSPSARSRLGRLRTEVNATPSSLPDHYVPSPINDDGSWLTAVGALTPPSPSSS